MGIRGVIEIVRRVVLACGIVAAGAMVFWTGFAPYVMVEQPKAGQAVQITLNGESWQAFFKDVARSFADNMPVPGWEKRVTSSELADARRENPRRSAASAVDRADEIDRVARLKQQYGIDVTFRGSFRRLYFAANEPPLSDIAGQLRDHESTILACPPCAAGVLAVTRHPAIRLHGFSDVITVPQAFAYPLRHLAHWPLIVGLIVYIALPWQRRRSDTLAYTRWRLVLGDVAGSFLLFGVFAVLPFAIIGGTVEAVTQFPLFVAFFWLLAALGCVVIFWSAWAAAYRLKIADDRLEVGALGQLRVIALAEVISVEPVSLRAPKWLLLISWLAVFLGGASRGAGQAGRAMLLSSSSSNGLRLRLKAGGGIYVWLSDQMGNSAMMNVERLEKALRACGAPWSGSETTIRAIIPPQTL